METSKNNLSLNGFVKAEKRNELQIKIDDLLRQSGIEIKVERIESDNVLFKLRNTLNGNGVPRHAILDITYNLLSEYVDPGYRISISL
ncbi:MAG: hypothetical protein JW894_15085 [Bacteroidales bacterium]|nr:hypothetical protein [Bacteroidales bacterium]